MAESAITAINLNADHRHFEEETLLRGHKYLFCCFSERVGAQSELNMSFLIQGLVALKVIGVTGDKGHFHKVLPSPLLR